MPANHLAECPSAVHVGCSCTCEVDGVYARCMICAAPFAHQDVTDAHECPQCKTKIEPMHPLDDVEVKVNWLELRVLVQFAERMATEKKETVGDLPKCVYAIASRIETQHPSMPALSLAGEMRELKEHNPGMLLPQEFPDLPPRIRLQ